MNILEGVARAASGTQSKSAAETVAMLRLSRPEAPRDGLRSDSAAARPAASDTTQAEATQTSRPVERPRQTVSVAVDLIPGSSRLVTSVFDSTTEQLLFRIPTWWNDVENALGGAPSSGEGRRV